MSQDPTPDTPSGWSDSDQRWFDALGGHRTPQPGEADPAVLAGSLMREAFERADERAAKTEPLASMLTDEAREARKARMRAQLQAQGVLGDPGAAVAAPASTPAPSPSPAPSPAPTPQPPRRPAAPTPWWSRWLPGGGSPGATAAWPRAAVLAAAVAVLVIGAQWALAPHYPEPPILPIDRGEPQLIVRNDAEPRRAAEALAGRLKAGGLRAAIYQRRDVYFVDLLVLAKDFPGAEPVLTAEGLPARPGDYRVEIRAR